MLAIQRTTPLLPLWNTVEHLQMHALMNTNISFRHCFTDKYFNCVAHLCHRTDNMKLVHWLDCCIWYSEEATWRIVYRPTLLLTVPNIAINPLKASVSNNTALQLPASRRSGEAEYYFRRRPSVYLYVSVSVRAETEKLLIINWRRPNLVGICAMVKAIRFWWH